MCATQREPPGGTAARIAMFLEEMRPEPGLGERDVIVGLSEDEGCAVARERSQLRDRLNRGYGDVVSADAGHLLALLLALAASSPMATAVRILRRRRSPGQRSVARARGVRLTVTGPRRLCRGSPASQCMAGMRPQEQTEPDQEKQREGEWTSLHGSSGGQEGPQPKLNMGIDRGHLRRPVLRYF